METLVYTFSFFILFAVTIPVFAKKKELLKTAVNVKAISCLQPALGYLQMLTPFPKHLHAPFVKPDSSRLRDRCSPWRCSVAGAGQNRGPAALPSTLCGEPQHVSPGPGCAAEASAAVQGGGRRPGVAAVCCPRLRSRHSCRCLRSQCGVGILESPNSARYGTEPVVQRDGCSLLTLGPPAAAGDHAQQDHQAEDVHRVARSEHQR